MIKTEEKLNCNICNKEVDVADVENHIDHNIHIRSKKELMNKKENIQNENKYIDNKSVYLKWRYSK